MAQGTAECVPAAQLATGDPVHYTIAGSATPGIDMRRHTVKWPFHLCFGC